MTLPKVHVKLPVGEPPEVWLNDEKLPGVLAVHVTGQAGEMPRVSVTVRPGELTMDLPETGVQILRSGPTASEFAAALNPKRLEQEALARLDDCSTQGEAFAAAVADAARLYDGG